VRDAAAVVGELILDDSVGEAALRTALAGRYRVIRPFLVLLAQALPLVTAPARQKILVPWTVRERQRWSCRTPRLLNTSFRQLPPAGYR
jgi:hypothetical protein